MSKPLQLTHEEGQILSILFYPARKDMAAGNDKHIKHTYSPIPFLKHYTVCILLALDGMVNDIEDIDCSHLEDDCLILKIKQNDDLFILYRMA